PRAAAPRGDPAGQVRPRAAALPAAGDQHLPVRPGRVPLPVLCAAPASAAAARVPHAGSPHPALARGHERVDERAHRVLAVPYAQGEPPAGGGGDPPAAPARRAALRAPVVGGAPPHGDPVALYPVVLRGGGAADARRALRRVLRKIV